MLTPATTRPNLEGIVPSEPSPRMTNTVGFRLYGVPKAIRFMETESRVLGARGWGRGKGKLCHGDGVSVWEDEVVEVGGGGDGCRECEGT